MNKTLSIKGFKIQKQDQYISKIANTYVIKNNESVKSQYNR